MSHSVYHLLSLEQHSFLKQNKKQHTQVDF